jgi:hypothetical protein
MTAKKTAAQKPGAVPQPAKPAPVGATRTGDTVTVACKLPAGLIIRGMRPDVRMVPVLGGGHREEKYWKEDGRRVEILGNAKPQNGEFKTRVEGGYALTHGVPKDLWEQWLDANEDQPMVQKGLIMAFGSVEDAAGFGRDNRAIRSGLERLNPAGDSRNPRPLMQQVTDVATGDNQPKIEAADEEFA